jgi:hypothetical protein
MQSVQVLDGGHLLEIHFQSVGVEAIGTYRWIVHGNLDLHGQTHPISRWTSLSNDVGYITRMETWVASEIGGSVITPARVARGTLVEWKIQQNYPTWPSSGDVDLSTLKRFGVKRRGIRPWSPRLSSKTRKPDRGLWDVCREAVTT